MRSVSLILLLLGAACLLACMAGGVDALPRHRQVKRAAAAAAAADVDSQGQAFIQQQQEADQSTEIVSALQQLLAQKKASGAAARAKLEAAAQHTLAVEAALAQKSEQLKTHNAMLARLEQCLASGPAEERYNQLKAQVEQKEQSLLEATSTVEEKDSLLAEQAEELDMQKEALETQAAEIADKEAQMKKAEAHLKEQQSLLEKQALEVTQNEQKQAAAVAAAIEQGVAAKLQSLKAEMEAQAADKLNAVKAAMQAQAQAMLADSHVALMERKAASIAHQHEMRDLTSADASPYAAVDDQANQQSEEEPMLIETSAMSLEASTPAPAAKNATVWARKLAAHCQRYSSCKTCGQDGRCGWCSSDHNGGGKCLPLDVNSNLRGSHSGGDGLTSGQCTSDNWNTAVAARLTFLSLNVFASERGNSTRRFAAIVQLVKKTGADVIAFQEVEKWFVHALQAHTWVKNNYHFSEYGPGQAPGGLFILSRYPIAGLNYYENIQPGQVEVSARGRVLVAKLGVKQQAVYVATTALDYRSSENRAASLEFIVRTLKPYRHVFLLGDFNFDEGSKTEASSIPRSYLDLWPTLISDKPGYTWDPRSNWFAAASDPQSRASRIDRVYMRSNLFMARSIHLVGCSVSDPLCGAKNLDLKKGATLINAHKHNPALILGAPTGAADKRQDGEQPWGTKIFLEEELEMAAGTAEHAKVQRALAEEQELEDMSFLEMEQHLAAPRPTFEPDFVPSNHFGLLVQTTQFAPKCPEKEI